MLSDKLLVNSQKLEMKVKKQNFPINNFLFSKSDMVPPQDNDYEEVNSMEYKTKLKEIELKKGNGSFLEKEKANNFSFSVGRILRNKLLLLPYKLAPIVSEINNEEKIYKILKEELENVIREIRKELARKI